MGKAGQCLVWQSSSLWSAGQEGIKYYIALGRPKAETSFLFFLGEAQASGTAGLLAVNFQLARDIAKNVSSAGNLRYMDFICFPISNSS